MKKYFPLFLFAAVLGKYASADAATTPLSMYDNFKQDLSERYNFDYNLDYSLMVQRTSPSGKNNAVQSYFAPSIAWTTFDNKYGTGILNASYNSIFYGNHNAQDLQNRSGFVSGINDFTEEQQSFSGLYYTYQLPAKYNWLTFGAGQYTLYNFDGTDYDNNQQQNFLNDALAQNGSATYADAGLGAYMQANPGNWLFVAGFQDATNIEAPSIRFNHLDEKHYTTFSQIGYNPQLKWGAGQYSIMVYNQPYVEEQPQSTTGWSLNMQQNIGQKFAVFGRINGVSGNMLSIKNSYVAGMVYNNPLDRNELDQIGLAYAYNDIDETAVGEDIEHAAEQVVETYWAWGISKWATLTPDIQFYINPALNRKSEYGTAVSMRLSVFF